MDRKRANKSAGIGDPYWYEWGIGLLKAVEMLNPDSGIAAVAFQKDGVKGWDDVVIRLNSGHENYYQVKHSRPRTNLTFSDLVGKTDDKPSLLASLTSSWHEMDLLNRDSSCILITNRSAGTNVGRSRSGIYHPPLAEFIRIVSGKVKSVSTLADVIVPEEWKNAWGVWQTEMGSISDDEKLQFLKQLTISVDAPQLEEMRDRLAESIASSLQITRQQSSALVLRLLSALFDWTTSIRGANEWITAEDVMAAIAESEPGVFGYCDVPTPIPFFPSRERAVEDISSLLTGVGEHRVVFIEAEPGSGKTSVVSRIVNQRVQDYSALVVDLRYYAYKPITPDAPALPADVDHSASPESLWYTLLSQIRERLRGRLLELGVPVRNNFTTPDEARDHVLRLAAVLGSEKGSPFVIAIDGIDHAARASRKGLPSLLGSMPGPETVPEGVRILIAGQPVSGYPEYPIWLKGENDLVMKSGLGPVDTTDVQLLLSNSSTGISPEDHEHAARVVQGVADGNTLATVFAVAEAETCSSLNDLEARLSERKLHSGVHAYYSEIWQAAIPESPVGLGVYLSSVLCLLRERITGNIMKEAFPRWEKPAPEWNAILKKLEPLVVYDADGYRVRHNDIRVFLEQELRTDKTSMQQVASLLADYYMGAPASPLFRQQSLFSLLQLAGRELDKAQVFTPNWVLDAVAYGRKLSTVYEEAEDAFRAVPAVKEWDVALSVACGGMTLTKLSDCLDAFPDLLDRTIMPLPPLPQCFETERFVLPFNQWDESTLRQVLNDVRLLDERGEPNRARGIMEHWLTDVSPADVVSEVKGVTDDRGLHDSPNLAIRADSLFEDWGALSFRLGVTVRIGNPSENIHRQATFLFEKGWARACVTESSPDSICSLLRDFQPRYLGTFEVATEEAAKKKLWNAVANLLDEIKGDRDRLHLEFRIKAAYWALKAIGQEGAKEWLEVLDSARSGKSNETMIEMSSMIFIAKAIGWTEPQKDASAITSELTDAITKQGRIVRDRRPLLLPLRTAAMVGLVERMVSKGDSDGAAALVPAPAIRRAIELIWENRHSIDFHEYRSLAMDLTFDLIRLCQDIGGSHGEMVLSLAISETEHFPVDQKMHVLWEVLRRAGQRDRLRKWAEHWIGQDGAAWSGLSYSERAEIVRDLALLCRDEGWTELAETAEGRLRHRLIGYSGHKEYSFQEPLDWIEELFLIEPRAWRREGLQLLDICRECDNQGGDNRLSSSIENEVATAAFRCGPDSAYAFFNWIDPELERYWLQTVRSTLIAASRRVVDEGVITDHTDILALWCSAVGLTRWFDRYQVQALTAFRDTILSGVKPDSQQHIADQMQDLTPGEYQREEYDKDQHGSESSKEEPFPAEPDDDVSNAIIEMVRKVDEGYEPKLIEICHLARRITQENPSNRVDLMRRLFELIDANRDYLTGWKSQPLKDLVSSLRENELWALMRAAVRYTGEAYWSLSVPHNVHLICLYRAAAEGADYLRAGAQRVLAMHRLWEGIPESQWVGEQRSVAPSIDTWPRFVVAVCGRLLSSDSAETVSAALRALCAIAEIAPHAVSSLLAGSKGILRSRLLIGAEVWAPRQPMQFAAVLEDLWKHKEDLCFSDRIQLWVCSLAAAQIEGAFRLSETFMPHGAAVPDGHADPIFTKPKRLLEIGPEMQGSVPLANAFSAAKNWIDRIRKITGCNTDDLEGAIAEGLDNKGNDTDDDSPPTKKQHFATEDGDMVITRRVDSIFDEALLVELRRPGWTDGDASDVAVAVTHGDDPWILRRSPLPSPETFDWPDQKEVEEWLNTKADKTDVLNRLRLLARGDDLASHQQVLGSSLRVFTSHYDILVWYWIEAKRSEDVVTRNVPLCPCGRFFQFFLPERFEPSTPNRAPLVFFSRSFLCLSFSTLEVIPSRVLQTHMGWQPKPQNPLEWIREGRVVAKFEIYHGPLDYNWGRRHMRQPTLSRWVVKKDELKDLECLSPEWQHEVHQFRNE